MNVYYLGGSPCSGKSTAAEIIADKYGLYYFKVDDFLEKYTAMGKEKGYEICSRVSLMSPEETWMRKPEVQCEEELKIYGEMINFIMDDIKRISSDKDIIAEGAAFLPDLMRKLGIDDQHYICITPTKDFQIDHYKNREWVPYVLEGCSDKEKAFENWMERDALFAQSVRKQCEKTSYRSIITDENSDVNDRIKTVCRQFNLYI